MRPGPRGVDVGSTALIKKGNVSPPGAGFDAGCLRFGPREGVRSSAHSTRVTQHLAERDCLEITRMAQRRVEDPRASSHVDPRHRLGRLARYRSHQQGLRTGGQRVDLVQRAG